MKQVGINISLLRATISCKMLLPALSPGRDSGFAGIWLLDDVIISEVEGRNGAVSLGYNYSFGSVESL